MCLKKAMGLLIVNRLRERCRRKRIWWAFVVMSGGRTALVQE